MEKFPSKEKDYTLESLEEARHELYIATERFNSFNDGNKMGKQEEGKYMNEFAAARDDYTEKVRKVKEIEVSLES